MYAWFAVTSTVGMACGLSTSGWISHILQKSYGWDWKEGYPVLFGLYAIIGLVKAFIFLLLTVRCEPDYIDQVEPGSGDQEAASPLLHSGRRSSYTKPARVTETARRIQKTVTPKMARESRGVLIRLCFLFALNSFAAGLLPVTVIAWYANWRYRWFVTYKLGNAMAGIWLVASIANLFSASVARRLGLVRAMVVTHLPAAIFLAFVPLATSTWWLLVLLLLNSAFGSMDQAPRSAFVAAVFPSSERTAVMGTINLVRTVASAGGPLLTGYFHDRKMWYATFYTAAGLKVLYDIGLLAMFLNTKLPEHGHGSRTVTDVDVEILLDERLRHPEEFETLGDEDDDGDAGSSRGSVHGSVKYEDIDAA